jgi:hypothetical protein
MTKRDINPAYWDFSGICAEDPVRAARLEASGGSDDLPTALSAALSRAIETRTCSLAVEQGHNFKGRRSRVQFEVAPELYDWFFNGRTGYRAQFWICTQRGLCFNETIVAALWTTLNGKLNRENTAHTVRVTGSLEEDIGTVQVMTAEVLASLEPAVSHIWIAEHLLRADKGPMNTAFLEMVNPAVPKLLVPRWDGYPSIGAPDPGVGSRLEVKGGFLSGGVSTPSKPPIVRARKINETGWI